MTPRHVTDVAEKHASVVSSLEGALKHDRMCELNVLEQVVNVCQTTILRDAWARGQAVTVHGWVYSLRDGRVHDLCVDVPDADALPGQYAAALDRIRADRAQR